MTFTSNPASVYDLALSLKENNAIDNASIKLHYDEDTPLNSSIEFGLDATQEAGFTAVG